MSDEIDPLADEEERRVLFGALDSFRYVPLISVVTMSQESGLIPGQTVPLSRPLQHHAYSSQESVCPTIGASRALG